MYKRYKSGHHSNRTVSDGNHGNPEPDQSARRAQSVTEAVISRGLSNLSVVRFLFEEVYIVEYTC